ncbi:MAG: hypothetical protein LBH18_03840, partial [Spirochaetaceae bacterium]|nr:hypothetical protein [Spirochaetaceae bacterium]
ARVLPRPGSLRQEVGKPLSTLNAVTIVSKSVRVADVYFRQNWQILYKDTALNAEALFASFRGRVLQYEERKGGA